MGGDLSPARLLNAYRQGIFPWYSEGEPILWWSPAPRAVLFPEELQLPRSLRKRIRQQPFEITINRDFPAVVEACAAPRGEGDAGTWITTAMQSAYVELHQLGHAHSIECWQLGELVGGLYGVSIGGLFCGESMFSRANDASKIALVALTMKLIDLDVELIDIQMMSAHLQKMGAREISRIEFHRAISTLTTRPTPTDWSTLPPIAV